MEVWRTVLVEEHADHDTKKPGDFRHYPISKCRPAERREPHKTVSDPEQYVDGNSCDDTGDLALDSCLKS
jgi:hypothetical protein